MDNRSTLNDNLIAAGLNTSDPNDTYTDFARTIAKNQEDQAAQEQAVALAKQHVAQASLQTKQQTEASDEGVNPYTQGVLTPEQAAATLKLILKEKGMTISEEDIDAWVKSLDGKPVNREVVEEFANRFARESTRSGQPAQFATTDKIMIPAGMKAADIGLVEDANDPSIGHVPEDGMYQVVYDNQGNVKKFIPGGKEPVDPSVKADAKTKASQDKSWADLAKQLTIAFKTRSGGLGSVSTSIFRATRAINTIDLYRDQLTSQDLENIAQDIGGIFQGGAPTVVSAEGNNYPLVFSEFQNTFRKYTGILIRTPRSVVDETANKMLDVLKDLRDSAIANLDSYAEFLKEGYRSLIESDPQHWEDMKKKYINLAASGLVIPPGENTTLKLTGIEEAQPAKPVHGDAATKAPAVGPAMPSMDEIQAEKARRQAAKGK